MHNLIKNKEIDKTLNNLEKSIYTNLCKQRLEFLKQMFTVSDFRMEENLLGIYVIYRDDSLYERCNFDKSVDNSLNLSCIIINESKSKIIKPPHVKKQGKITTNSHEKPLIIEREDFNGYYFELVTRKVNPGRHKKSYNKFINDTLVQMDLQHLDYFRDSRPSREETGYFTIRGSNKNGFEGSKKVSRLIMAHMMHGIYDDTLLPKGLVVNHIDENTANNRGFNLELITPMENQYLANLTRYSKENNEFGFGIKLINDNQYEVTAYQILDKGSYRKDKVKIFADLEEGRKWKLEIETKHMRELSNISKKKVRKYLNKTAPNLIII